MIDFHRLRTPGIEWSMLLIDVPRWDLSVKPEKSSLLHCCHKMQNDKTNICGHCDIVHLFGRSIVFLNTQKTGILDLQRSSDSRGLNHREAIEAKLVLSLTRLSFPMVRLRDLVTTLPNLVPFSRWWSGEENNLHFSAIADSRITLAAVWAAVNEALIAPGEDAWVCVGITGVIGTPPENWVLGCEQKRECKNVGCGRP